MTKSLRTNIWREIWGGRGRFLSILTIVAIGVGFFGGVRATGADMRLSADTYYHDTRLMDFRLVSMGGFSDNDIGALRELEGVEVIPSQFTDCIQTVDGVDRAVRVVSLEDTEQVNHLVLLEGRLPQAANECLADGGGFHTVSMLGSVITLKGDRGADLTDTLQNTEYTVVGLYESPMYVDASGRGSTTVGDGSLDAVLVIPAENFVNDFYTQVYLCMEDLEATAAYSDAYETLRDDWADRLEQVGDVRAPLRLQELIDTISEKIADGQKELDEGWDEVNEARAKLADARAELDEAARTIADGEVEMADARRQLNDGWRQLEEGQQQLIDQINSAWAQYDAGMAAYTEGKAQMDAQVDAAATALRGVDTDEALDNLHGVVDSVDWSQADIGAAKDFVNAAPGLTDEQRRQLLAALDAAQPEEIGPALHDALDALAAQQPDMNALADELLRLKDDSDPAANLAAVARLRGLLDQYGSLLPGDTASQLTALLDGYSQLMEGRLQLSQSFIAITDAQAVGQRTIDEKRQELEDGERSYQEGMDKLADGRAEYEDGLAAYQEARAEADAELPDAERQLHEAEEELDDARQQLADLTRPEWYIFDRDDNPGYAEYGENAERIDNIARIFPVLFLLVAGLVSLTTMSRMVDEQRTQIGTLKALGYTNGNILTKYMLYALSAAVLGSVLGLLVGFQLFPIIIIKSYGMLYRINALCTPFHWPLALGVTAITTACIAATVWSSCRGATRHQAATLMRPKAPPEGKTILLEKIGCIWRRLNFSQKVSARNIFRYKKRMMMALIGISGCTALVLTGFGLKDSISDIVGNQFTRIWQYDATAALDEDDAAAFGRATAVLTDADAAAGALLTMQKTYTAENGEARAEATVLVPQAAAELPDFIQLQDRRSGQAVTLAEDGVVITEKLSVLLGLQPGDTLTLRREHGGNVALRVDAITENYLSHYIYIGSAAYRQYFAEEPGWNALLCRYGALSEEEESALATQLLAQKGVLYVTTLSSISDNFTNIIGVLDLVVVVLIISAGALAFVVLYNLTNININERVREIATLKVLGFNDREVSAYIFRETMVLTLLGATCGLLLGYWMAMTVITTAEIDMLMFGREIKALSYVWAFGITFIFNIIVSLTMHRRLQKISMVESLKSVE